MDITPALIAQMQRQYRFQGAALEKTLRSLQVLDAINQHEDLQGRFVLYGGTALHMFHASMERLSVDLDLIYCGNVLSDLERTQDALKGVLRRFGETLPAKRDRHIGYRLWEILYTVKSEDRHVPIDVIKLDISFEPEILLYPPQRLVAHSMGPYQTREILIAAPYDVAAGKLNALIGRSKARDLYDVRLISQSPAWNRQRVQKSFLASQANQGVDVRTDLSPKGLDVDKDDLRDNLLPLLKIGTCNNDPAALDRYGETLLQEVRCYLNEMLTLTLEQEERLNDALYARTEGDTLHAREERLSGF